MIEDELKLNSRMDRKIFSRRHEATKKRGKEKYLAKIAKGAKGKVKKDFSAETRRRAGKKILSCLCGEFCH